MVNHAEDKQRSGKRCHSRFFGIEPQQEVLSEIHEGYRTGCDGQRYLQASHRDFACGLRTAGTERLAYHHAHGNGDGKRYLIERCGDVADDLVRGDIGRTQARNEDRHERKGAHFKENRKADRHAEFELSKNSLDLRPEETLGAHLVVEGVLLVDDDVADERQPRVNRERQSGTRAAQCGKAEPAVHEDAVERYLAGEHQKAHVHRHARAAHRRIQSNEASGDDGRENTRRGKDEKERGHASDFA